MVIKMKTLASIQLLRSIIVIFLFFLQIYSFTGNQKEKSIDSISNGNLIRQSEQQSPQLLLRYEKGTSLFRLQEDIFRLREVKEEEREKISIRVCSTENLLLSLPLAALYKPENISFTRSNNCVSPNETQFKATELWVLGEKDSFPSNDENYRYEQVKMVSLGFDPIECKSNNYKKASREIINKLLNDKNSFGVIIGYFLEQPKKSLVERLKKVKSLLLNNKVSQSRFIVTQQRWHFGDSNCSDREPEQPTVIFITTGY
jgi:hypothetical protein